MVFCYQNCSDLLGEKKCSSDREKLLDFETEGQNFPKFLKSNSEISEQFLVTECFSTCSWRFLISNKVEQLELNIGI